METVGAKTGSIHFTCPTNREEPAATECLERLPASPLKDPAKKDTLVCQVVDQMRRANRGRFSFYLRPEASTEGTQLILNKPKAGTELGPVRSRGRRRTYRRGVGPEIFGSPKRL